MRIGDELEKSLARESRRHQEPNYAVVKTTNLKIRHYKTSEGLHLKHGLRSYTENLRLTAFSMGASLRGGVHAVLGDFVDAASGRLDALAVEMVEGDAAFADGIPLFNGHCDVGFGKSSGFQQRARGGQLSGDGGSEGATGTVSIFGFYFVAAELDYFGAVEEDVDGAFHMAAFYDDGVGAHFNDFSRGGFHVGNVFDGQAGEDFGFRDVGRDDAGALEQFGGDIFNAAGIEELRAAGGFHYGVVDNVREFVGVEKFADDYGVTAIAEHADFYRSDVAVVCENFELFAEFGARRVVRGFNALGILHGERSNRGDAVAAVGCESL